jgi:hypothetical protein
VPALEAIAVSEPNKVEATPPSASPGAAQGGERRLSDKIAHAMHHAFDVGRRDIGERLKLLHQALRGEDAEYDLKRRKDDWEEF